MSHWEYRSHIAWPIPLTNIKCAPSFGLFFIQVRLLQLIQDLVIFLRNAVAEVAVEWQFYCGKHFSIIPNVMRVTQFLRDAITTGYPFVSIHWNNLVRMTMMSKSIFVLVSQRTLEEIRVNVNFSSVRTHYACSVTCGHVVQTTHPPYHASLEREN